MSNSKLLITPIAGFSMVIGGAFLMDLSEKFNNGAQAIMLVGALVAIVGVFTALALFKTNES